MNLGLTALLLGQQPEEGGLSMGLLGLVIFATFLIALVMAVRSFIGLRGWAELSCTLSTAALVRQIAPSSLSTIGLAL